MLFTAFHRKTPLRPTGNRTFFPFLSRKKCGILSLQDPAAKEVVVIHEPRSQHVRHLILLMLLFLVYLASCMIFFSFHERTTVSRQTLMSLRSNVEQQCAHFNAIIDIQFESLETLAEFASPQEDFRDEETMALANAIVSSSDFSRILLIQSDGIGFANDGAITNVSRRNYFLRALTGTRSVSDPLSSSVDSQTKVVLAVPITDTDGVIRGVVGGAYSIGQLNKFLFSDLYQGSGYPILLTSGGVLISTSAEEFPAGYQNFYDYCASMELLGGADPEQVREDFANGASGYFIARSNGEVRYMVYQAAGLGNGWMMCYTVTSQEAGSDYSFIIQDVFYLGTAVLLGVLVLLATVLHLSLRERRRLLRQAQTDPLTGLLNRSSTVECVTDWLTGSGCHGALMMLDLDNFKEINDAWGHQAGDAILALTADLLRAHFRQSDVVGRIGGDEFMVLMKDVSSRSVVEQHMCRLCEEFRLLTHPDYPQITLSCSVGAAMAPNQGRTFEELYAHADRALYCAKHRGKDSCSIYTEDSA